MRGRLFIFATLVTLGGGTALANPPASVRYTLAARRSYCKMMEAPTPPTPPGETIEQGLARSKRDSDKLIKNFADQHHISQAEASQLLDTAATDAEHSEFTCLAGGAVGPAGEQKYVPPGQ